jgi:hypothetical protein
MSGDPRIERRLPGILADLGAGAAPDYAETLLARTAATRQRPGWLFPGRWIPMTAISERLNAAPRVPWRALALAALLLIGLIATALFVGSERRLPPPFGPAANGAIPYVANSDLFVGRVHPRRRHDDDQADRHLRRTRRRLGPHEDHA